MKLPLHCLVLVVVGGASGAGAEGGVGAEGEAEGEAGAGAEGESAGNEVHRRGRHSAL